MEYNHEPVMLKEIIEYLEPKAGGQFIDCTLGGGGYTMALSKIIGNKGKIISIDLDEAAIKNIKLQIKNYKLQNIITTNGNFKDLSKIIEETSKGEETKKFDGIVFDLGLSSYQLQDRARGFSFLLDGPLDMSFGQVVANKQRATEHIVNNYSEAGLEKIIREYGEERFARKIAQNIIKYREQKIIKTSQELAEIVVGSIPKRFQNKKIHPATKTFQAIRMATNDELESLREVLPSAINLLKSGGRLAIVSFHSLEDRIVKHFFKKESRDCLCLPQVPVCVCNHQASVKIISKKPITPSQEEIERNPRSRSAKLRIIEKL
jgi:16S rRNA (cytosine1402-N4)-methyltransferase